VAAPIKIDIVQGSRQPFGIRVLPSADVPDLSSATGITLEIRHAKGGLTTWTPTIDSITADAIDAHYAPVAGDNDVANERISVRVTVQFPSQASIECAEAHIIVLPRHTP